MRGRHPVELGCSLVGALLASAACGGAANSDGSRGTGGSGSGGAGSSFPADHFSGLSSEALLTDLSDADFSALCRTSDEYFHVVFSTLAACRYFSAAVGAELADETQKSDVELQQKCTDIYDGCLTSPFVDADAILQCPNRAGTCTATVGGYEACITSQRESLERWFDKAPVCSALTWAQLPLQSPSPAVTPACLDYYTKCPGE
ncbi:MAG: hypothetical protein QM756_35055 [Polyangiaceae bacterium]